MYLLGPLILQLGVRLEASGFDVYRERIGLRTGEKILLMAKLWLTSLIPETFPLRK